MDIGFTEEQELLRETARRFLESECGTQFVRATDGRAGRRHSTNSGGSSPSRAGSASSTRKTEGGSGLGLVDLVVLMEEMGRAVMPGPFLSTVLLGGAAIAEAGSPAQRRRMAAANRRRQREGGTRLDRAQSALGRRRRSPSRAREAGGGFTLSGTKLFVGDAHLADMLVVAARTRDGSTMEDGVSLFLVPKDTAGAHGHGVADDRRDPQIVRGAGSTMSHCRRRRCSAKYTRAGRRCRG